MQKKNVSISGVQERKPVLLIVDDQPLIVRQIFEIFQEDFHIFMASDGDQCLKMCVELLPDVVLLDVNMPKMNGYDTCDEIKSNASTSHIPVIFVTASISEEDEVRGFELGAVDFIRKPINPTITWARVLNHVQLKRQSDMLRSLALIDGLTGVSNRFQFEEQFLSDWMACARGHVPFSLLMVDVDHFKQFNDEHGHQAGDECLRTIAQTISAKIRRPNDMVARYGGEEFACLLPNTGLAGAEIVATEILRGIEKSKILFTDINDKRQSASVTVSIGVACHTPLHNGDPKVLIRAADEQLYIAKNMGRNRISSCEIALQNNKQQTSP